MPIAKSKVVPFWLLFVCGNSSSGSGFRSGGFGIRAFLRYSAVLTERHGSGSGFGSWKTLPAVPVSLSAPGRNISDVPVLHHPKKLEGILKPQFSQKCIEVARTTILVIVCWLGGLEAVGTLPESKKSLYSDHKHVYEIGSALTFFLILANNALKPKKRTNFNFQKFLQRLVFPQTPFLIAILLLSFISHCLSLVFLPVVSHCSWLLCAKSRGLGHKLVSAIIDHLED